ncbi:hypothetical protein BOTBODRAFT_68075 [Botryobasidium botryosum FD-172 SS1]|uniref:Uncharacterized protein n=1 Tax=Botryobasidium botryosum (strain FD-172 SS1) TaxID=930990 RepID=A0A067MHN5_BOTB1|nr:hypothetical protein BOTBODRAFT_68075 [Botryobasidium botryosum FD-172 SS1]
MNDYCLPIFSSPLPRSSTAAQAPHDGRFQRPQWWTLVKHVAFCAAAGPVIYFTVWGATKRQISIDLFRAAVNVITTLFGTLLGISLAAIAVRHFQAGAWATIAEAQGGEKSVTIGELDGFATGGLLMAPYSLLKRRFTKEREHGRYPWALNVFIFLLLIALSKGVSFLLERTIIITSYIAQQPNGPFYNVSVVGDVAPQDLTQAQLLLGAATNNQNPYLANWISAAFTGVVRAPSIQHSYQNNTVFFSEVLPQQLLPGAQGPGTFNQSEASFTSAVMSSAANVTVETANLGPGQLIRWPRWGIRVTCESLPNPALNLVPFSPSEMTYVYLPNSLITSLAAALQVTVSLGSPWNASQSLAGTDTLPAGLDPSTIFGAYTKPNDGSSHSGTLFMLDDGTAGDGWKLVDVHLARVDRTYAPNGSFLASAAVNGSQIGYDAVVCLEVVEPWILQAYNYTGSTPYTTDYILPGASIGTVNETLHPEVASSLNSTTSWATYTSANYIARKNMLGPPAVLNYAPTPILVDFTGGSGSAGYTSLSPSQMESVIGAWDSSQALPYLVGSGYIAAQASNDRIIAAGAVHKLFLSLILAFLLLLGIVADVCIPMLPHGMPLRDFSVLSSITIARSALRKLDDEADERDFDAKRSPDSRDSGLNGVGPEFNMHLEKLKGHVGDVPTVAQAPAP